MSEFLEAKDDTTRASALSRMIAPGTGAFRADNNRSELRIDQFDKGEEFVKKLRSDVMGSKSEFPGIDQAFTNQDFLTKLKKKYKQLGVDVDTDAVKNMYSTEDRPSNQDTLKAWAAIEAAFAQAI